MPPQARTGLTPELVVLASYQTAKPNTRSQDWNLFLAEHPLSDEDLRTLVYEKQEAGHYQDVIGIIEASLIAGRPQPWMYQVLALTMQIENYPQDEVERVLLSMNDFRPMDVPALIYSAAFLTRLGAKSQALSMYRQASRMIQSRPEPYILGLKLAVELEDAEGIIWALDGILQYDWSNDHQKRHEQAIDAGRDLLKRLSIKSPAESNSAQLTKLKELFKEATVCDLQVRLEWSGEGDLDLLITEPTGSVCSFENPLTNAGGVLVHDGAGPDAKNSYDEYFCTRAFAGDYQIRVRHVYGGIVRKKATLLISEHVGTDQFKTTRHTIELSPDDVVVEFRLTQGRREVPAAAPTAQLSLQQLREQTRKKTLEILHGRYRQVYQIDTLADIEAMNQIETATSVATSAQLGTGGGIGQVGSGGFVTGVTPNSGVGYSPVVTFINDGVTLNASATVSADRRYVRLNLSPSFTAVSDVFTFTFLGGN